MDLQKLEEGIYLKKGKIGYEFIFPIKKDLEKPLRKGNIDWKNVFGMRDKKAWIYLVIFLLFIGGMSWFYYHDVQECFKVMENPCEYCGIYGYQKITENYLKFNLTELNNPISS